MAHKHQTWSKMVPNGPLWSQMFQSHPNPFKNLINPLKLNKNCSKLSTIIKYGPMVKMLQYVQKLSNMFQMSPKWSKMVKKQNWSKMNMVHIGQKCSKIFQNLPIESKMVQKGRKLSKNCPNHPKFLPLFSKWVRHNQVPWSSFI